MHTHHILLSSILLRPPSLCLAPTLQLAHFLISHSNSTLSDDDDNDDGVLLVTHKRWPPTLHCLRRLLRLHLSSVWLDRRRIVLSFEFRENITRCSAAAAAVGGGGECMWLFG